MREHPCLGLKQRKDKEEIMTQDTCNGSAIMLDTVFHSFTVNYSTCIGCLPGTPSVDGTTANKAASDFKGLLIS